MGNLSFLSAWSNSSPSLVYRPCALAGAARLQRLSEAEPLDGSFVRGAKTWAPRAGARARARTDTVAPSSSICGGESLVPRRRTTYRECHYA